MQKSRPTTVACEPPCLARGSRNVPAENDRFGRFRRNPCVGRGAVRNGCADGSRCILGYMGAKLPTLFIPHGGGPCFFMEWTMGPPDTWHRMAEWLRSIPGSLPETPRALLVISGHWEAPAPTVTTSAKPSLIYDYGGFPPHTYELKWPAPGAPELAGRVQSLVSGARADATRGFDHGVFIPLK